MESETQTDDLLGQVYHDTSLDREVVVVDVTGGRITVAGTRGTITHTEETWEVVVKSGVYTHTGEIVDPDPQYMWPGIFDYPGFTWKKVGDDGLHGGIFLPYTEKGPMYVMTARNAPNNKIALAGVTLYTDSASGSHNQVDPMFDELQMGYYDEGADITFKDRLTYNSDIVFLESGTEYWVLEPTEP